ncbi:MAG: glycosyltransferase family 4 protein [Candidatus Aenigmatarchaeota archaeon]
MKACFFANASMDLIENVEFYKNDIRILKELGFQVKIANKLRNIPWDCDIYFAWWASSGIKPLFISKILRKPCIIVAGGSDVSLKDRSLAGYNQRNFIHKFIIRWTLRNADAILAVSKDIYEDAISLGAKRIHLVYNCIDTEKYVSFNTKKEDIVLAVSHLSKQNIERKGIKDIINSVPYVIKKYPKARFVIIGKKLDGYEEIITLAKSLGVEKNIEFVGFVSKKEKISLYNKAKVFVSPSEHEGFGIAIAEAMSCKLPVIVTNRGAIPEVVGNSGIYVKLHDVKDIANAIIKLLSDEKLRKKIGENSRKQIEKFNYERRKEEIRKIVIS